MPAGHLYADTQQAVRRLALALNGLSMSEDMGADGIAPRKKTQQRRDDMDPKVVPLSQSSVEKLGISKGG